MARKIIDYLYIIFGSLLCSAGIVFFTTPAKIASGGVSGIATMVYHTLGWNSGYVIFGLSLPLFLIGMKVFGKMYGFRALVGTVLLSLFTTLLMDLSKGEGILDYTQSVNVLLSSIFGGLAMGVGTGLVMRGGSNTGGTDIVAQILNKYTPMSLGSALILVDAIIIAVSIIFFGVERALLAVITVYICGISIDKVAMLGSNTTKVVMFISEKNEQISEYLMKELNHGATLLEGKGMYTGNDRPVLMAVISNQELPGLISHVKKIDDKVFMIIQNAYEVLGEGFTPVSKSIDLQFGN